MSKMVTEAQSREVYYLHTLPVTTSMSTMDTNHEVHNEPREAGDITEGNIVEVGQGSIWYHRKAFFFCTLVCLCAFQLGLDLGAISGLQAMPSFLAVYGYKDPTATFGYGITAVVQQLISSLMSLGAVVGCALAGPTSKIAGRKWALAAGIFFNQLGTILMIASTNTAGLYAGRLIVGVANGFFDVFPQLYIHECAPPQLRGPLLGMFTVLVSVGLLVGSIVDNYTAPMTGKAGYQIPLGLFFVVPMVLLVVLPFMPETPRWLLEYRSIPQARNALIKLRNPETSVHLIDAELEEIKNALDTERELAQGVRILDMFRGTNLRRTLLSIALLLGLCGGGSLFFLIYGTYFFALAGQTKAFEESIGMTAAGLVGTLFSMWLVTKIGRRTIFMIGFFAEAICMLVVAIVWTVDAAGTSPATGRALVAFSILFLFVYNMCCAPYLYLSAGEIPTQRLRSYTLGISIAVAFLGNWLVSFTAPYFLNPTELNWGAKYGFIWAASNLVFLVFIFFFVPETKDRTLEEIDEMFEARVGARQFKSYVCVKSNDARQVGLHRTDTRKGESEFIEDVHRDKM